MKKTGFLAFTLALALLAGCSGGSPAGDLVADSDDMAFQTADIQRDRELLTVDGQPITAESYLFWLVSSIETARQYGMLEGDGAWDEVLSDGLTMREAMKADALETAKLYRVVETKAAEYGVSITPEQEQTMADQLEQTIETMGKEEFQLQLDSMCVSREGFNAMTRVYYLYQGLEEKLEESGEIAVTEADKEEFTQQFLEEGGVYAAKHILLSTRKSNADGSYEEMSDEERAVVEEQIKDLREQLRAAGDSEELFDQLMNEYSEDGRDEAGNLYAPNGYGLVYAGEMVPEFEEGALELEVGQIGEPVATAYGYHIILRIPVDQAELDALVEENCSTDHKFQLLIDQWLDQAQVVTTAAYDELDPESFYEKLSAIMEAKEAALEAQATPEPSAQ